MSNYLEPLEDGLPIRDFGPWVKEKLDYLKRYIDIFETSMHSKPWRERHFIDLFAGTGKCRVAETRSIYLGSALLALTTSHPFTHYYLVEKEPENSSILRTRCVASAISSLVDCKIGDGNMIVREIIDHIKEVDRKYIAGSWSSLNLAFLDPDGLELRWQTVATLAEARRMDLIIHYPQGGLTRNLGSFFTADEETPADLFFGGSEWREIYQRYRSGDVDFAAPENRIVLERSKLLSFSLLRRGLKYKRQWRLSRRPARTSDKRVSIGTRR